MFVLAVVGDSSEKINAGKVPINLVVLLWFLMGITLLMLCLRSTVYATKIFCVGWGCHALLISAIYKITNDHQKFHDDPAVWIGWMTRLIIGTGFLILIMDYSKTKSMFNSVFIGYFAAVLHTWIQRRKDKSSVA